jgi:hypothetical protein
MADINKVLVRGSNTSGVTPSSLTQGSDDSESTPGAATEIAINRADGKLFYLNDSDAVTEFTPLMTKSQIDALGITTVGALASGSIAAGFGAIDNGTSNITTGGLLSLDIDSASTINSSGGGIGAAGSITLGVGADAGMYVSGDNLYIENKTSDKDIIFRANDGGTFKTLLTLDGSASGTAYFNDSIFVGDDVRMNSDGATIKMGTNEEIYLTHTHNSGLKISNENTGDANPVILTLEAEENTITANDTIARINFKAGDSDGTDAADIAASIAAVGEATFGAGDNSTKLTFGLGESGSAVSRTLFTMDHDGYFHLDKDAGAIKFGADSEVTLTHVHDTGLLLNGNMELQFNDASQRIWGSSATVLSIAATDEIDLTATAIDINGTANISGTLTLGTVAAAGSDVDKFLVLDGSGNVDYRTGAQTASDIGALSLSALSMAAEGTASGDGGVAYNNSTGVFTYTPPEHDSLSGFVTNEHIDWTADYSGTAVIHANNYTNTTYSVGDGGLTSNDFTDADHTKLNGIATSATANAGTVTSVGTGTGLTGTVTSSGNLSLSHLGIESLSDPGADRLLIWDDSAGAIVFASANSNLAISGTNVNATNTTYSSSDFTHDDLTGFVANEHIDHSGVTFTAGTGLSGGGTIAANRTFAIDISEYSAVTPASGDSFLTLDSNGSTEQLTTVDALATLLAGTNISASSGVLSSTNTTYSSSDFTHDDLSGFVANEHIDHSGVTITAGDGLTGGGTIASTRTLNVVGGDGITANANDVAITAAQTTITSILHSGLVIGRDSQNDIDFGTDNTILFRADNTDQVKLINNVFSPVSDSDVDLGTTSLRWKDAFVDSITVTGEVDAASLDIEGNADINGTLEADAITVNGTALNTVIAGVTVDDATVAAKVALVDESSDSSNYVVFSNTATGDWPLKTGTNLTFDANVGELTAVTFNPSSGYTIGTGDGGGHTINNVDIAGEFTDSDEHLMTAAAINDRINAISTNNSGDITNVGVTSPITGGGSSGSVTIAIQDASTSAKGAAQFSSSYFSASSGTISIKDDGIDSDQIAAGAIDIAHLSASGSASGSTYLRGDNTWASVSGGSSLTVGSDNQIPVVNGAGNDLEYTSNFTYDGTKLIIIGDTNDPLLELRSTDDDANEGPVMNFFRTSGSGQDDDIGGAIQWNFTDEGAWGPTLMGSISMKVEDETVSSKDSHFMIKTYKGNTLYNLQIGATGATSAWSIKPSVANTLYLGSSSYDLNRSYVRSYYGYDGSGYSAGYTSANTSGPTAFQSSNGTDIGTGAAAQLTFASAGGAVVLADIQPAPSDSRYKENVADLDKGMTFLESLPSPKTFDFKDTVKEIGVKEPKKGQLGFLAQDIEKVLPDVITTAECDESEFNEFKTINYPELDKTIIYSLINAVKELSAKVKALEDA